MEAGVGIIGASGGATAEHVKMIAESVRGMQVGAIKPSLIEVKEEKTNGSQREEHLSNFKKNLGKKFLATVELDIPRGLDMSSVTDGASFLAKHGIDAVNISDGARARIRVSYLTLSKIVQDMCGIEVVAHLACRDRHMVGL